MPFGIESDDHQTDFHGERHPLSSPESLSVVMNPRGQPAIDDVLQRAGAANKAARSE